MIIIVKIIIFPCIVMAYYQLSIAVPWIILTPFRLLLYFIPKIRRSLSESTEIDLFIFKPFIIIFLALFLFSHFYWSLWNKPLIHLWASPLLIASLYLHSTLVVSQVASYNPFVRQSSGIVLLLIIPITAVLFVGYFTKNIISITMVKWAIPLGVIVAFIDQLIILLKFPSDFREIKRLTQRHNEIGQRIQAIKKLFTVLGESSMGSQNAAAFNIVQSRYDKTLPIQRKRLKETEDNILMAEIGISEIEQSVQTREKYWIRNELSARISQLKEDLSQLKSAFQDQVTDFQYVDTLAKKLDSIVVSLPNENAISLIISNESLFQDITSLRTALSFRQNFAAELEPLKKELAVHENTAYLGMLLNIETEELSKSIANLIKNIQEFKLPKFAEANSLLNTFHEIQSGLAKIRSIANNISEKINRYWKSESPSTEEITAYIPKMCATNRAEFGAIIVNWQNVSCDMLSFHIEGSLIDVPNRDDISIEKSSTSNESGATFHFSGKKSGVGALVIRSNDLQSLSSGLSFSIRIIPSSAEMIKDSSLWAAPFGGIVFVILWQTGTVLKEAAPISAAIGAICCFVLFVIKSLKKRRHLR